MTEASPLEDGGASALKETVVCTSYSVTAVPSASRAVVEACSTDPIKST
jgi:hypothetical protein